MMFIKREDTELQTKRKLQKAGAVLGFSKNQAVTAEMVKRRFTELVKLYHPDSSPDGQKHVMVTVHMLDDLRKAKEFILKHVEKYNEKT